ncbi:unnamed protein product [Caenorhabditis auriculariae]|uniref:Uncharacterized protein n=1 Tax=Caenorhabditis auriculariae TaxID=2777116 RepID=A0A8S1GZ02_9PELO|nr:unnamed protein product [Caenorhabditis auriculariae]
MPHLLLCALLPILYLSSTVTPFLLYGCGLSDDLCDSNEYCFPDGVFGQCYSEDSGAPVPTALENLDDTELQLLQLELVRLASKNKEWAHEETQCVLAYFKLSMAYSLQYDPDFCQVRNPSNIWALIQLIDVGLAEDPSLLENPSSDHSMEELTDELLETSKRSQLDEVDDVSDEEMLRIIRQLKQPLVPSEQEIEDVLRDEQNDELVQQYLEGIVHNENPDFSALSDDQLTELIERLVELKNNMSAENRGEQEMVVPLDALGEQQSMLKKDIERVGEVNTGLDNTEHKIVKGRNDGVTRVAANRVYLKVNIKEENQLYPLIEFLQNTIALPNNLIFDDFQFENGQLSMRISRLKDAKPQSKKRIESVEGVAQAVYKRRKDIARLSGAEVAETGIGIGDESLPIESTDRDWMLAPALFVCVFTITALVIVAAAHLVKSRRHSKNNIQQMADQLDGKSSFAYQDLCRQRASMDISNGGRASKSSSTSSWCDETAAPPAIDISTGHVVLNFLQECLSEPTKMEAQWNAIKDYKNVQRATTRAVQFAQHNRSILPFDDNIVEVDGASQGEDGYLNASFIYDDDPKQPMYIVGQTPTSSQIRAFWQAVWQHGVCLIVNVSTLEECRQEKNYWPDTGSEVYGPFEIHLVSEHIWSDDYLVRSFYLKNLQNSQTRTITQFHYLSWAKNSTPPSAKSLLEFRRKVNKSYRGRSSAVLVHSWDGSGRTGAYCAVDVICARLLRGVRQIDVVATVEHLRDQRDGMVGTGDQFKLVYGCVAQEMVVVCDRESVAFLEKKTCTTAYAPLHGITPGTASNLFGWPRGYAFNRLGTLCRSYFRHRRCNSFGVIFGAADAFLLLSHNNSSAIIHTVTVEGIMRHGFCLRLLLVSCFWHGCHGVKIIDNGLAPPEIVHTPLSTKPRCKVFAPPLDLVFLLDSSGSLRDKFQDEIDVIRRIINHVTIGNSATRVMLIQFSGTQHLEFNFDKFADRDELLAALDVLRHVSGITRIGAVFEFALEMYRTPNNGWRDASVPKIIYLLSDGRTHDYPKDWQMAETLRSTIPNVDIWAYGTGDYVAMTAIANYTQSEAKITTNQNLHQLETQFDKFHGTEICEAQPVCIKGSDKPLDLLLVVDASESLDHLFADQASIKFLMDRVIDNINIHPEAVRLALISYSGTAFVHFKFNSFKYNNNSVIKEHLKTLRSIKGTTSTQLALEDALDMLTSDDPSIGTRRGVPKMALVMTDGHSQRSPKEMADKLRAAGIITLAVSVTPRPLVDEAELLLIGGDQNRAFSPHNLQDFEAEFMKHVGFGCDGVELAPDAKPRVRGATDITCEENALTLVVRTQRALQGVMYANNFHDDEKCILRKNDESREVRLTIVEGTCGLTKTPTPDGHGYHFNLTVILQFHPLIITRADQGLDVGCFLPHPVPPQELQRSVSKNAADSICVYRLHRYGPTQCVALDAKVGETIYHKWECDTPPEYNYLVHDCHVESEQNTFRIVDENGCEVDQHFLETPNYSRFSEHPEEAYVFQEMSVFKFPGDSDLVFHCKVSLCDMTASKSTCAAAIPPRCSPYKPTFPVRQKRGVIDKWRRSDGLLSRSRRQIVETKSGFYMTMHVETRTLNVLLSESIRPKDSVKYCDIS